MNIRHGVSALPGMILLLCLWLVPSVVNAQDHDEEHLLVLNSYHPELPWTKGLMRGLDAVFRDSGLPLVTHVEYLDGIRHRQEDIFPVMLEYLGRKYARIPLQGILATDDVALDFLFLYRDELFPDVPVIFCGPNDFTPQRLSIHIQVTGIAENPDMRGTIDLVRTLHPGARAIAVVADRNPASLRVIRGLREIEDELGQPGLFTVLTDAGLDELLAELQALPAETPVIFHAFLRDAAGRTYPSNLQNLALLSSQSGLPFYTFKKIDIGHGAVGGAVISEELMAEIAAGMAVQILQGVPPGAISPVYDTPQVYLFDDEQLRRFSIKPDRLPEESVIINRPFSLYHDHKEAFHVGGAVLALLLGLLAALVARNRREYRERRRAEQEREKLQSQLLQAQKMESVGILAGGVAHDFNNLLHVIRGNIELLARSLSNDSQGVVRIESVMRSLDRAARLVQQLLLFSRKAEFGRERIDLNHEVREAVRMLERTIPKMVALELHLEPAVWPISGDSVQIEQVLFNLANNSVDAMPDGGRLIIETGNMEVNQDFVRLHPGAAVGPHVLLTVSDTGRGMDEATLKHVFDPFFTTKEVGQGTGLGLASVYGIVKAHGGYIQCYSESGQGTTFRIYLPATQGYEPGPDAHQNTALQIERVDDHGGQTILVVDDDREIRELTQEALEDFGYVVRCAANGEEALDMYLEHGQTIALILLDLNMPGMGGHKCLQELLRINPSIRVVIASGYSANGQARETLNSGAAGFIGKPYQLRELAAVVREALGRVEEWATPRPQQ